MQITRDSLETAAGPADWFTGDVYIDTIATVSRRDSPRRACTSPPVRGVAERAGGVAGHSHYQSAFVLVRRLGRLWLDAQTAGDSHARSAACRHQKPTGDARMGPSRPSFPRPWVQIPGRQLALYSGPIEAAITFCEWPTLQSPNLWWPHDRAWCVASEIDVRSTYVGGTQAASARRSRRRSSVAAL